MKKRTLFACGLAAALFAGCSDSDNLSVENGGIKDGTGHLSLNISLPTTNGGSRASTDDFHNDIFDNQSPSEYAVKTLDLICYDGSGTAVKAFNYTSGDLAWSTTPGTANGITTDATLRVEPVDASVTHILVLINKPSEETNKLDVQPDGKIVYTKPNGSGTGTTTETITTYTGLKSLKLEGAKLNNGGYFFMTNSPLSEGTNAEGSITELVPVTVHPSKEEAASDVQTVNVERAMGKVTLTNDGWTDWTVAVGTAGDKVKITNWALDITNKISFPIRNFNYKWEAIQNTTGQRFRGTTYKYTIGKVTESANRYRTYWAQDPNYLVGEYSAAQFDSPAAIDGDLSNPLYCNENTFEVKAMDQRQTTRAILAAQYTPNGHTPGDTWYRLGNSNVAKKIGDINDLIEGVTGDTKTTLNEAALSAGSNQDFEVSMFTFDPSITTDTEKSDIVDAIKSALGNITVYKNGVCYYTVRIQHFGSTYTPWGAPDYDAYLSGGDENDKKYLGRYGIVRNNWYQLELSSVSAPGEPTVPTPPATNSQDDEHQNYIQANVKIMDWAVRKQSVNL